MLLCHGICADYFRGVAVRTIITAAKKEPNLLVCVLQYCLDVPVFCISVARGGREMNACCWVRQAVIYAELNISNSRRDDVCTCVLACAFLHRHTALTGCIGAWGGRGGRHAPQRVCRHRQRRTQPDWYARARSHNLMHGRNRARDIVRLCCTRIVLHMPSASPDRRTCTSTRAQLP